METQQRARRMTSSAAAGYVALSRLQWTLSLPSRRGRHNVTSRYEVVVRSSLGKRCTRKRRTRCVHYSSDDSWINLAKNEAEKFWTTRHPFLIFEPDSVIATLSFHLLQNVPRRKRRSVQKRGKIPGYTRWSDRYLDMV